MKRPFWSATAFGCLSMIGVAMLASAYAADVSRYSIVKQQNFVQNSAGSATAATTGAAQITFTAESSDFISLNSAKVRTPGGTDIPLPDSSNFTFTDSRSSLAQLDTAYASGAYTFTFDTANDGMKTVSLNLPADAFPAAPVVISFSALQTFDATKDFTVQWAPFVGGTANDFIQLRVLDSTGFSVFETDPQVSLAALKGTATTTSIPAGSLNPGETYTGVLTFLKAAVVDLTSYPGAAGSASFSSETRFAIKAVSGTGGTGGGTAPTVLFANPPDGASNVSPFSPIVFIFSTAMAPSQSIAWTGTGVNTANFQYTWPQPNTLMASYTGGLPSGTKINYTLNPPGTTGGFKDLSGTVLATFTGSFTTTGSTTVTNKDCTGSSINDGTGSVSVGKHVDFIQTNSLAPVINADVGATFSATVFSPTNNPVKTATVRLGNGTVLTLTNTFGRIFSYFQAFQTQAALDAAYPAGTYVVSVTRASGASQTVSVTLQGEPPVPQLLNYDVLNAFNSATDMTLLWNPFLGAAAHDMISVELHDKQTGEFHAPDFCIPRPLTNTATSVVVPKNTLAATDEIDGELLFLKASSEDKTIADLPGFSSYSKGTEFRLRIPAGPSPGTPAHLGMPVILPNSAFQVQITGQASAKYQIETSTDLKNWTPVLPVTLSGAGSGQFTLNANVTATFVRARAL